MIYDHLIIGMIRIRELGRLIRRIDLMEMNSAFEITEKMVCHS